MAGLTGPSELHGVRPRRGGGGREKGIGHREPHVLTGFLLIRSIPDASLYMVV